MGDWGRSDTLAAGYRSEGAQSPVSTHPQLRLRRWLLLTCHLPPILMGVARSDMWSPRPLVMPILQTLFMFSRPSDTQRVSNAHPYVGEARFTTVRRPHWTPPAEWNLSSPGVKILFMHSHTERVTISHTRCILLTAAIKL